MAAGEAEALSESLNVVQLKSDAATLAMSMESWQRLRRDILARLRSFHADNPDLLGMGVERLRAQLEFRLPAPACRAALNALVREGETVLDGAWVRLAEHRVTMTPADERLWKDIEPLLGERTVSPATRARYCRTAGGSGRRGAPAPETQQPHGQGA